MAERSHDCRVAVAGAGSGRFAVGLALSRADITVAGFDRDPAAVSAARRLAAEAGVADRVTFEVAATVLGGGYDLVYARLP